MKSLSPAPTSAEIMLSELAIMTAAVNYRNWMYENLHAHLGRRVVEIGAGIGNFTRLLLDRDLVVPVDSSEHCLAELRAGFSGHRNIIPVLGDIADGSILSLSRYAPDTVVCLNVLEHVENDRAALEHMHRIMEPSGTLALLVPAFPIAYGTIDRLVGHFRRYRKKDLREKLERAGFFVTELYYMNSLGLAGWFLNNRILKRTEHTRRQVLLYDSWVIPWLHVIEKAVKPCCGLSLIAIAEKKGAPRS